MSMTKTEKQAILMMAAEIERLADMGECGLNDDTKQAVRPYMSWFFGVAECMQNLVLASDRSQRSLVFNRVWRSCPYVDVNGLDSPF